MNLSNVVDNLISDTLETSLPHFKPELVLCACIVVMLLFRILPLLNKIPAFPVALLGSLAALILALPQEGLESWAAMESQELFTGLLVHDTMTAYIRVFLMSFAVLFIVLSQLTGLADREDGQDFFSLVLGATIGMSIMASANHMLTVFLGVEMASVPSYVLAGVVKGRRRSSEAALKYAIYGAGTAGVMLYGISLLCGVLGTAHIPSMASELYALDIPAILETGEGKRTLMVLALGGLMMGVGLAFKLSAVPFHFWCPDVFEGASAEVDGFLSVASKAAALALLLRVGFGLGYLSEETKEELAIAKPAAITTVAVSNNILIAEDSAPEASADQPLTPVRRFFVVLVAIVAVVTCTFGNLAAYGQTNIKRMLAYSTIAHAGYMMMAVAAAIAIVGQDAEQSKFAVSALLLYMAFYLFMNLGAFAIIAFLRNAMQSEEIKDYAGLVRSVPVTAIMFTAVLVSLIGLPPLAGFWPKLRVLQSLYEAGGTLMIVLLVVAGLNTAISLVYYLRVVKTMCIDEEPDSRGPVTLGFLDSAYVLVVTIPVMLLGIFPDLIAKWTGVVATQLFS